MHEGHRDRVYKKFLQRGSSLSEVELVELALFYSIPVQDVKPIAYELIEKFGTLENVINSPIKSLMTVKGVGRKTASFLKLLAYLSDRGYVDEKRVKVPTVVQFVDELRKYFEFIDSEKMIIFFLNENGDVVFKHSFSDYNSAKVTVDFKVIAEEASKINPSSAIIAHNHLSGLVTPSSADDITTKRLLAMMNMIGVKVYDHIIIGGENYYSYHVSGRLKQLNDAVLDNFTKV